MNFQSLHFVAFLWAMVVACGLLWRHFSARKSLILVASWYFYMCWDWRFGGLLLATTVLLYVTALRIHDESRPAWRRLWLGVALAGGLGALGSFKYANFFIQSVTDLLAMLGVHVHPPLLKLVLPIGISFFTFQGLSYVVDVFRRQLEPTRDLRDFALFVSFFPTVLAGPITRGSHLLPQFARQHTVPAPEVEQGLALVARGFIKKIVFADVLAAQIVDPAFANPQAFSSVHLLLALYAYNFQIYMDVSGYTDIARGAALLCGFRLPENFNRPYIATSVSNFWQRWHISMSTFFRDYVFVALGGSRHGNVYFNVMLTFLAIGLWHGGGWNFLLYGAVHGALVCLERFFRRRREAEHQRPEPEPRGVSCVLRIVWVFHFVAVTRILFRSEGLESAAVYIGALAGGGIEVSGVGNLVLLVLLLAAALHWCWHDAGNRALDRLRSLPAPLQALALTFVVYAAMAFSSSRAPFVYFMF